MTEPNAEDPEPIPLFEFLHFEFHFEMAAHIQCEIRDLVNLRKTDPTRYKTAAMHIFNVVSGPCRAYLLQKGMEQYNCEKRLATTTA